MKKRTAALTLVLIGPTLVAGCSSRDCDLEDASRITENLSRFTPHIFQL